MPKKIAIKLPAEIAIWARRRAGEENNSISKLVSGLPEREMRLSDAYWRPFEYWKSHRPIAVAGATGRMSRSEARAPQSRKRMP